MFRSTHTIKRMAAGLAVAAAMATLVVPTALAGGNSGYRDGWYGWAVALTKQQHAMTSIDGRSPDTRDAAAAAQQTALTPLDGRSPDTRDAATLAQQTGLVPLDGRTPDTIDAAVLAHSPTVTVYRSRSFEWGDFGIGVAAALGAIALMLGLGAGARGIRRSPGLRSA